MSASQPTEHSPRKLPAWLTVERILIGLAIIAVVIFAGEEIRPKLPAAEKWIADQGIWAPILFIALMAILSIVCFPLDVLFIAGGLIFHLGYGFGYVIIGIYLGQSINFWLARTLLLERVQRWIKKKPKMQGVDRAIRLKGTKLLFMLRMAPLPSSPISYLLGTTTMRYTQFLIGNLGLLPVAFASMYFGYAAVHATRTSYNPKHHFDLNDAAIFGGVILAIGVMTIIGHQAKKMLEQAEEEADGEEGRSEK
ncbi:TVP38/TMEM64 family protein [Rubellicoccus peritrichatus]|uniref:TVP38/TMEM64 family membrane protein n=1 Tax=Rubellicoccus peritrichatus TaxID=3080537 RepID=A0AAQ3LBG2_9BACT|nr:VTT domain-containing protein [Puniceicoccus sp. CR14]WOO41257.1 VTT domain-containing protein [Puniceicoccus sp. CR14]